MFGLPDVSFVCIPDLVDAVATDRTQIEVPAPVIVAPEEFVAGRIRLAAKVRQLRPQVVAFLGMGAYCHAFGLPRATVGEQGSRFEGARVWVLPNTSGLNANYQLAALVRLFKELKRATD